MLSAQFANDEARVAAAPPPLVALSDVEALARVSGVAKRVLDAAAKAWPARYCSPRHRMPRHSRMPRHRMPPGATGCHATSQLKKRGFKMRVDDMPSIGPGRCCSPRHSIPV